MILQREDFKEIIKIKIMDGKIFENDINVKGFMDRNISQILMNYNFIFFKKII